MDLAFCSEEFPIPRALRADHDQIRAQFVTAASEPGPVGQAAMTLARLCLPHFEREEKTVFPAFALLHDLALGHVSPEMSAVMPLITNFNAWHESLGKHHQTITVAVDELARTAHRERNRAMADFAARVRIHESIEDEVLFLTVKLIGNYLRERLKAVP